MAVEPFGRGVVDISRSIDSGNISDKYPNKLRIQRYMTSDSDPDGDKVWFSVNPETGAHSGKYVLVSYTDLVLALRMITGVEDED